MNKKKRVFSVSVHTAGKGAKDYLPGRYLSIGKEPDCEIDPIPGFPERHRLLEKTNAGYNLIIPSGLEGLIARGNTSVSLQWFIEFGLLRKKGNSYLFPIPGKGVCILTVGGTILTFGYKEILPEKKKEKIDRSLRRPLIDKRDCSFLTVLFLTALINFSMVTYLNSLELKKKDDPLEAIRKMPQRFAKLILQPQKLRTSKAKAREPVKEKKEEIKPEKEAEKEAEPLKEENKIEPQKEVKEIEPQEMAMIQREEKISASSAKDQIREKVKTKGLLGVIMAKALPDGTSSDIVFRDVDKLVRGIEAGSSDDGAEGILDIKGLGKADDLSKKINETMKKTKRRGAKEIIAEKGEIIKEELNKNKEGYSSDKRKRDEADVYRTVSAYIGGLKYLYNNALRKSPSLKGKITVKIVISQDGKVVKSEVVSSTLGSPELEEAIVNRIYRWHFSELTDVDDFTIDYTFDFAPVG